MQKLIQDAGSVLDKDGRPNAGYATKSILQYNRKDIKAPPWRIKEWDFYQVTDGQKCLQFTIGHAAYAGQVCIMLFDFQKGRKIFEKSIFLALPFGSMHMPVDAEKRHVLEYENKNMYMRFIVQNEKRVLRCKCEDIEAEIFLERVNPHSLAINIPFDESPHAFYYNHKINCMTARGHVQYKTERYEFDASESFGLLDWGRGVWPFHNEWYWSNGTGYVNGEMFGFNLGCGFGNTSEATENILFYQGKAHKLEQVDFRLGKNYMEPWHIRDKEGRLDLTMTPVYDRTTKMELLWVNNFCHQMFGTFHGTVILDDGTKLEIEHLVSFAEHAVNNW